ncbi:MAG: phosphate acyltransferase PlsX [Aminobacteriaceae bacterium]
MILAVDAMGGDHGPSEICRAALMACEEYHDLELALVGSEPLMTPLLEKAATSISRRISIVHTNERVEMNEHPTLAIRKKKNSSIRLAMEMVRSGEASGCVSAGNTGAVVAGGVLIVGRITGIDRPALGVALPTLNKYTFLLDVGANVRNKPFHLYQFAHMGNIYSKRILGVAEPQIALLSNGSEDIKGDDVVSGAKALIAKSALNFSGYVEGDDIPYSRADVVVCDGFSGNVVLKFAEGLMTASASLLKEEIGQRILPKVGMLFMLPMMKDLMARFHYEKHGGTPLLGVNGAVIKAHGRSKAPAIVSALRVARSFVGQNGVELIREELG